MIVRHHWRTFGRDYYARHDYEEVEIQAAQAVMEGLRTKLSGLKGQRLGNLTVLWADEFSYVDPIDGSRSDQQGIRIVFAEDARAVFRVSGTGTSGATIRVYLERYQADSERLDEATSGMLAEVVAAARSVSDIAALTGRSEPSVVT
jgi:phosphoglucomutase